jgi:hypothetical protein
MNPLKCSFKIEPRLLALALLLATFSIRFTAGAKLDAAPTYGFFFFSGFHPQSKAKNISTPRDNDQPSSRTSIIVISLFSFVRTPSHLILHGGVQAFTLDASGGLNRYDRGYARGSDERQQHDPTVFSVVGPTRKLVYLMFRFYQLGLIILEWPVW